MNEVEKTFEMINGVIHYREYKFEMIKDTELSQEDYEEKRAQLQEELDDIQTELDRLHAREMTLDKDLSLFTRFDSLNAPNEEDVVYDNVEIVDEVFEEVNLEEDNEEIISEPIVN